MSHAEQRHFCDLVRVQYPSYFVKRVRVLEIGSLNVNGSVRCLFDDPAEYIGVDCHEGPCVDVVGLGHEVRIGEPESFDVVCSCECFEHDPHAGETVANMLTHLRDGGLFFSTCAGTGRPEHGTRRTGVAGGWGPNPDFYRNVTMDQMFDWLVLGASCSESCSVEESFTHFHIEHNPNPGDLHCYAIKRPLEH